MLSGESFGQTSATTRVTIGGRPCDPIPTANQTDYSITCLVRQYYGEANPVIVFAGGRASNALVFAYDPPVIQTVRGICRACLSEFAKSIRRALSTQITPSTPDANGQLITFGECLKRSVYCAAPLLLA